MLQTLLPLVLPPDLVDALRRHRLMYAPLFIRYTSARFTSLIHLRFFLSAHQFGRGLKRRSVGRVGSVRRKDRTPTTHSGTCPVPGLRVAVGMPSEVLLRADRAPVPAMHRQAAVGVRTHCVDSDMALPFAEGAGFVRPVAHRARQRWVVLVVCEVGEYESEKRAGSDIFPVVPVVHRTRDGDECCAYKGSKSHESFGRVAAFILHG